MRIFRAFVYFITYINMKKEVEQILSELYGIDENLKENEKELISIINSMINLKPNVKIDENFKNELRQKIIKEISVKKIQSFHWENKKASMFQIFSYVFWTAWVAAFWFFMFKETLFQDIDLKNGKQNIKFESTVTPSKEWFWELSDVWNQNNAKWWDLAMEKSSGSPVVAPTVNNKRAKVNTKEDVEIAPNNEVAINREKIWVNDSNKNIEDTSVIDALSLSDEAVSNDSSSDTISSDWSPWASMWYAWIEMDMGDTPPNDLSLKSYDEPMWKMIAPIEPYIPEVYRYSFSWKLNIDLKNTMPVYKRDNSKIDSTTFAKSLWNMDFAGVDVSNFSDLKVSNITLNEDKKYGYNIYVDFDNSSINISKNWTKWPETPYVEWEKQVFLEENEVIKLADDFLKTHKIDLSKYGTPKVEKSYMMAYAKYSSSRIMPEIAQNMTNVVYPLIVDWNEIVEEWGQTTWVRIEIDLKEKKVTSVNWLSVDNYLKSDYKTETTTANILKVASKWGRYGFYDYGTLDVKYIDVTLKNPEIKYVHTYKYNNKDNTQEQYLIPAVVFDVEKPENTENFYGENVVVPLLKDSYKYDQNGEIIGASE